MAAAGMAFRSTPLEPRPTLLFALTSALACRRLPLTMTRSWSGPSPRSVAGRTLSVPSVMVGRGKLNDGAIFWMIWLVSVDGELSICSCVITSTGTAFSCSAPMAREPTVISCPKETLRTKSWVASPPEVFTSAVRVWNPCSMAVTRTLPRAGTVSSYLPSASVTAVTSSADTVTPGSADPSGSVTRPRIVVDCAARGRANSDSKKKTRRPSLGIGAPFKRSRVAEVRKYTAAPARPEEAAPPQRQGDPGAAFLVASAMAGASRALPAATTIPYPHLRFIGVRGGGGTVLRIAEDPAGPVIRNSRRGVRNSTLGVPNLTLGVRNPTLGVRNFTLGVRYFTLGVRYFTLGVRNLTLGVRNPTLGVPNLTLGVRDSTSVVQEPHPRHRTPHAWHRRSHVRRKSSRDWRPRTPTLACATPNVACSASLLQSVYTNVGIANSNRGVANSKREVRDSTDVLFRGRSSRYRSVTDV
jgi:hypothetical protein